jgi:hypothetical protein
MTDSICKVDSIGTKNWTNEKHCLHRLDGPAIECPSGYKAWYVNGKLHRLDGPAREQANGSKEWWVNGKRHRLDGPAIEGVAGAKEWWVNKIKLAQQEFDQHPLVIFYRLTKGSMI